MINYPTIMVATDFSTLADIARDAGISLARTTGAKRLCFEHVVRFVDTAIGVAAPLSENQLGSLMKDVLGDVDRQLAAIEVPALPGLDVSRRRCVGAVSRELAKAAAHEKASVVVVASHGYGPFRRAFIGSTASGLIREAHCPVLVVGERRPLRPQIRRVLAAIDLSGVSRAILEHAIGLAAPGGEVEVVSLYEFPLVSPDPNDVLPRYVSRDEIRRFGEVHAQEVQKLVDSIPHANVKVRVEVMAKAPASQVILDVSEIFDPDLVVLGTSGRSAWHRLVVGSTATRVLNESKYPVLVVPHG